MEGTTPGKWAVWPYTPVARANVQYTWVVTIFPGPVPAGWEPPAS